MKYLNRYETTQYIVLGAFASFIEERVKDFEKKEEYAEIVTLAKTTRTYVKKLLGQITQSLDIDVKKKILGTYDGQGRLIKLGEIDKMKVVTRYSDEAAREYVEMQKSDAVVPVKTEDFLALVELAVASCSVCESTGDDVTNCQYKRLFTQYDIDILEEHPGENGCPYRYNRKGAKQ